MVDYKLYYFNFRGRAEIVRLIFAAAGQKYEDVRLEREKWPEYKGKSPLGQVPYLEVHDGGKVFQLGQSITIARYLARKFNLAGKGDEEQAEVEMLGDQVTDLLNELIKVHFEQDATKKADLSKKLFEETFPNSLKILNARAAKSGSGFLVSSGLTWADLYLVNILEWLGDKKEAILGNFSNLKALDDKVRTHPKIAEWLANRPKTDM